MDKIKELYIQLEKPVSDLERIELLHDIGNQFMYIDLARFEDALNEIKTLALKTDSKRGLYYYYEGTGRLHVRRVSYPAAMEAFITAAAIADEIGDRRLVAVNLYCFCIVNVNLGNFKTALEQIQQGIAILESLDGYDLDRCISYCYLGIVQECLGNFDEAENAYAHSIDIAPPDIEPTSLSGARVNYAVLKKKKKEYDKALVISLDALDLMEKSQNKLGIAQTLINVGEIYFLMKQYNEALKYYVDGLRLLKHVDNKKALMKAYVCLADVYMAMNGLKEAEHKLNSAFELLEQISFPAAESKLCGARGELLYRKGDIAGAKGWLEKSLGIANHKGLLDMQEEYGRLHEAISGLAEMDLNN